ncbi:MAG: glycosyltransferase family 9 protein [Candidatus Hydrogenedens sp.]
MKSDTIRFLDRWIGVFLCFLLTIFNKFTNIFCRYKTEFHKPQKILFIKLIEQGAMVLACPAIEKAKRWVGENNVYVCAFNKNCFVLPILGVLPKENIIEIDTSHFWTLVCDVIKYIIKCRKLGIDTAIDCEFFSRGSAIISFLSGARARIGMHAFLHDAPYRGDLMTHKVGYNPYIHVSYAYLLMVEAMKESPGEIPLLKVPFYHEDIIIPRYTPDNKRLEKWKKLLGKDNVTNQNKPYIIFTPNTHDLLHVRKWDIENYIQLAKKLIDQYPDITFVLTGFLEERESLTRFENELGGNYFINLAGETDFEDLLTLYTLCDVLVTNDSGPAHFATTSDINIVVLFGPETPILFSPVGKHVHILYAHLACSPCLNAYNYRFSFCTNNICLKSISVDTVFEEVYKCIQQRQT